MAIFNSYFDITRGYIGENLIKHGVKPAILQVPTVANLGTIGPTRSRLPCDVGGVFPLSAWVYPHISQYMMVIYFINDDSPLICGVLYFETTPYFRSAEQNTIKPT